MYCDGLVTICFHGNTVSSILCVNILAEMVRGLEMFAISSLIKIKCQMGYSHQNWCIYLVVKRMDQILKGKVVVV